MYLKKLIIVWDFTFDGTFKVHHFCRVHSWNRLREPSHPITRRGGLLLPGVPSPATGASAAERGGEPLLAPHPIRTVLLMEPWLYP